MVRSARTAVAPATPDDSTATSRCTVLGTAWKMQLIEGKPPARAPYRRLSWTMQLELMDPELVTFGLDMTHELDRRFGFPPKRTLSQVQDAGPFDWARAQHAAK